MYNILAGIFTSAGAEEDDPTFSYKDSEGKRFYYCERAGHHDSCGFNKKVDIYALGITILSMVKGYRMLIDNEDHGNHRLTCCKLMGTYPEDMKRGKNKQVLIDGMDVEKLMKDVPACYRLPGKSDFLILLKKMLCHVNERLSARALLSERSGKTWLRILPKYDERKMNSDGTLKGSSIEHVKLSRGGRHSSNFGVKHKSKGKQLLSKNSINEDELETIDGAAADLREHTHDIDLEPVSVKDQNAKIKNMKALMYGSVIERQDLSEEEKLPLIELYHPDASLDEMCHFIVCSKNIQKNENFSKYCVTNYFIFFSLFN